MNKIVSTKCCAILLTRSHRVVTTAVNPNVQQGNCFSFGFTELSVEQEKRAARLKLPGQLQNSKRKKKKITITQSVLSFFPIVFLNYSLGKGLGIRFTGVGCGCGRQDIQVELV